MRRTLSLTICLILVFAQLSPALLADGHRFELLKAGMVNGVMLEPGRYILEIIGENLGRIYRGKKLLVEAKLEVLPIGGAMPDSVSQLRDGKVKEIRLKEERVVFVDSEASAQTAR